MAPAEGELDLDGDRRGAQPARGAGPRRWVCPCSTPPTLLATVEGGRVNLKIRDRYYHIEGVRGRLRATCPRCGKEHVLALGGGDGAGE